MTTPLKPPDSHYLEAAQGWLDLGNHLEADTELDRITPQNRAHPDVLQVRWHIFAKAQKWNACLDIAIALIDIAPKHRFGWLHYAQSLHQLKRTDEARESLYASMLLFGPDATFPYHLACYAAQLGKLEEAGEWLQKAFVQAGSPEEADRLKLKALDEPDLEPLWESTEPPLG